MADAPGRSLTIPSRPRICGSRRQDTENPVANIKSAQKRARQTGKTVVGHLGLRSMMRTQIKNVVKACDAGNKDDAAAAYKAAVPSLTA